MIEYTVQTHPRARSLKIKILSDGSVVVVKPKWGFFLKSIDSFVQENMVWIENSRQKMLSASVRKHLSPDQNVVVIFGKEYQKVVDFSAKKKIGVVIDGGTIQINPVSNTTASIKKAVDTFLKTTAEKYLVPRTYQLAEAMQIKFQHITLRQQKTRWGSCSSYGNLNFNWQLVHSPPPVIDYVIIHELAHRQQMNHSARFWEIVRQYDPEYLKHRGWLKRQGMDLG
jgi:predicted metal-dependent hydrolase